MKKNLIVLALLIFSTYGYSQVKEIIISKEKSVAKILSSTQKSLKFHFTNDKLSWKETSNTKGEIFTEIWIKGGYSIGKIGEPKLPAYKKLVSIPFGSNATIKVLNYTQKEILLQEKGVAKLISPLQPSIRKDIDEKDVKFEFKKDIYERNSYQQHQIATIEVLGTLRSQTIARLVISPVDYNPVKGTLKVYNDIDVEITYQETDQPLQAKVDQSTYSPFFETVYNSLFNTSSATYDDHPDLTKYPVKMLIVSNRMFEQTLQPFIEWKKLKGFKVEVAYTDVIGTTADQIKSFIQQQYNSAAPDNPAPTFLVLVGDVEQLAASATGSATVRKTDLYYASVDGDMFPDMYYGRLSATSTAQLSNIINKILYYEKYQFADPSYLNQVTLIAGADASWNFKVGQPTLKYATANYFNLSKGFSSVFEYGVSSDLNNPLATSSYTGCYANEKISTGLVNYTAHCSELAWSDPSLSISAVNSFSNSNKYPLAIGNCCLSGDFGTSECIGEAWIRGENKGAVTYIGSSPSTYWLEDFYWAVGAFPMVGENNGYVPTFAETTTGMYDAPFVTNYTTSGAMVFAGNLAVTEVDVMNYENQSSPLYYWQAYNILGDPSLMPYFTEAENNDVSYNDFIPLGESFFKVNALAGSYIAISKNSEVIGCAYVSTTGDVDVPVAPITETGDVIIAITRPQTKPLIDTITAITPSGPYLIISSYTIDDNLFNDNGKADYNETFSTNIKIKNLGTASATNVKAVITGISDYITFTSEDTVFVGEVPSGDGINIVEKINAYYFTVRENIPDQQYAVFYLKFTSDQGDWTSKLKITLNSPVISVADIIFDDSKLGDDNGKLSLGETSSAELLFTNTGHSFVTGLTCEVLVPDSLKSFISLSYEPINQFSIEAAETHVVPFRVTVSPEYSGFLKLPLIVNLNSENPSGLSQQLVKSIYVLPSNYFSMDSDTITTCLAYFFDSGGEASNYSDDQDIITTFNSSDEFGLLKVKFTEFNIETNYDKLYIYNGSDINSPQISGSPFTGTQSIPEFTTSGQSVTFRFISDEDITKSGWSAIIECYYPKNIPQCATNPNPLNGAIEVSQNQLSWSPAVDAQFYDVFAGFESTNIAHVGRVSAPLIDICLDKSEQYFWKVVPGNYFGSSPESCEIWNFTTDSIMDNINMANTTIEADTLYFFDSGGSTQSYKNNENYFLTFKPKYNGNKITVDFKEFSVETNSSCNYDKLLVYDGLTSTSPLIGSYCGTALPGLIQATNTDGALSFRFISDESETRSGWKAIVRSIGSSSFKALNFLVSDGTVPLNQVAVKINDDLKFTNDQGQASFSILGGEVIYTISSLGFATVIDTINLSENVQTIQISLKRTNPINFNVKSNATSQPIHGVKIASGGDSVYTNPNGEGLFYKPVGESNFQFSVFGYDTLNTVITIPNSESTYEIELTPTDFNITFEIKDINNAMLGNAEISLNNELHLTNELGLAEINIQSGIYGFSISKSGYIPYYAWIEVNSNTTKDVVLEPLSSLNQVEIAIFGAGPKDTLLISNSTVSFYINDIIYLNLKTNDSGDDILNLPSGFIKYCISKEGYISKNDVQLDIGSSTEKIVDTLNQQVYSVEFSVSSNSVAVSDASVLIDGYTARITDLLGTVVFNPVGWEKELSFIVKREGYHDYEDIFDVIDNLHVLVNLTPLSTPNSKINNVEIFPNPAISNITVKAEKDIHRIDIINISGINQLSITPKHQDLVQMNIEELPVGVYFIRVLMIDYELVYSKFIKK